MKKILLAVSSLSILYLFLCLSLWIIRISSPQKRHFIDGEIDMTFNINLLEWMIRHFVNLKMVILCIIIGATSIYFYRNIDKFKFN
jgi:hypothetical protein